MSFIKYPCDICGKKYQSPDLLNYHREKIHGAEKIESQKLPEGITMRFSKHVEVQINSVRFETIANEEEKNYQMVIKSPFKEVSDMALAVEVLRIIRDGYGDVLIRG